MMTINLTTCSKEEFMVAFRKAKQYKREREKQLQFEWTELQKRAVQGVININSAQQ